MSGVVKIVCSVLCLGASLLSFSQNQSSFFKLMPKLEGGEPLWAIEMYKEDPNVFQVIDLYEEYYSKNEFEKTIHTQNFKHWLKQTEDYVGAEGWIRIPSSEEDRKKEKMMRNQRNGSSGSRTGEIWSNVGPFETYKNDGTLDTRPTQVNVFCLAIAPSDNDVMYCATEGGGLYKSEDHGLYWNLTTLSEVFTQAQDIKVHPLNPDVLYVGYQDDIYKSIDGGESWSLNFTADGTIEQFYIHKTNPSIVFAATADGLFQTTDDGSSWTNIFDQRCWDIEPHALAADTIYLSVHNAAEERAQVYRSADGGSTWILKDNGWYVPTDISEASDIGCKIGMTPADPDRVYACLIGESKTDDNGWIGVYYSLNEGDLWENPDGIDGGPYEAGSDMSTNWFYAGYSSGYHQGWYNFDLDVSHIDPDRIWIGTIWFCESGNQGANIEYIRGTRSLEMHADIQDIDVNGDEIWVASDGGINFSNDECLTVEIRNSGIGASDYWGFGHGWNEDTWTGGRYHNGDAVYHENFGLGNTMFMGGAETATGYIDPLNNRLCHFSDITDKWTPDALGQSSLNISNFSMYPNESYGLLNSSEVEYDPRYSNHLYLGSENEFYKSTDGGGTFELLYAFPTNTRVLEFEVSRSDPNIIYCLVRGISSSVGTIFRSTNQGNSFSPVSAVPSSSLSRLDLSLNPSNSDELWVSSHYGVDGQKVYRTTDGGASWENQTTSALDDHRVYDILYQAGTEDIVYLVTNYGVFYWDEGSADWEVYVDGLPFVTQALSFKPFYRDEKLRLSTGRGIWEAALAVPSLPIAQPMTETDTLFCDRDTVQFDCYSVLNHLDATWSWEFSPAPAYVSSLTDRNPQVVFGAEGSYDVTLTVTDGFGNSSSQTVENMVTLESQCAADSIPGYAMQCYADGDFSNVPDLQLMGREYLTISAWIKPEGIQGDYTGIVINDGSTAGLNFRPGNELAYHWPGGAWWWDSGLFIPSNVWSHVVMVASADSITLYLNGEGSTHVTDIEPVDFHTMKMGSYKGWGGRNLIGQMDEVCIWDRALTQDEVRELRHLTRTGPMPYSEDLVAYYQFNVEGTTEVLDKQSVNHASLSGGAQKVISTAPVGGGRSDRFTVNAAGVYDLPNTETKMEFASGSLPNGELVMTRIHLDPNVLPEELPTTGNYWILNNYGTTVFTDLSEIAFEPLNVTPDGDPENAVLYARPENDHLNGWIEMCAANDVDDESFYYNSTCAINSASQFCIVSGDGTDVVTGVMEESVALDLFPNPTGGIVRVYSGDLEIQNYQLFNAMGQLISEEQVLSSQFDLDLSTYSKGVYVVNIWVGNERFQKKVIRL